MLNDCVFAGRLTKEVDFKQTDSYMLARFTIACDRDFTKDGKKEADFIRVVCWGKIADFVQKFVNKGDLVMVRGRLQIDVDRSEGYKEYVSIVAENVYFGSSKRSDEEAKGRKPVDAEIDDSLFREINGDDAELPFD